MTNVAKALLTVLLLIPLGIWMIAANVGHAIEDMLWGEQQ